MSTANSPAFAAEVGAPRETQTLSLAVVIPTYLRERCLVNTIRLLLTQDPCADEILVIDQTPSHDSDTDHFLRCHAEAGVIRWIRQGPPNLPAARNRGLRETGCDIVLFLDDDVIPEPGLIAHHRSNYEHSTVDAVAGRTMGFKPCRISRRVNLTPDAEYRYFDFAASARRERVVALLGANHSVRRATALAIGGYDENYLGWAFREETDLALRLYRNSRLIVFDPRAAVLHLAEPSGGCRISGFQRMFQEWKVSFPAHYFAWKHLFPARDFWREIGETFTRSVLCKKNARAPHRLPLAVGSYLFALVYAAWRWRQCR
ncbi:MAG: putative glycosyltransferase [Candidatus Solibacter sp.]|nr:putative glycosyltransferase [Candidatus Solibacter sp.]